MRLPHQAARVSCVASCTPPFVVSPMLEAVMVLARIGNVYEQPWKQGVNEQVLRSSNAELAHGTLVLGSSNASQVRSRPGEDERMSAVAVLRESIPIVEARLTANVTVTPD